MERQILRLLYGCISAYKFQCAPNTEEHHGLIKVLKKILYYILASERGKDRVSKINFSLKGTLTRKKYNIELENVNDEWNL